MHFQWELHVFPALKKTAMLWNHLTVRMAGRNELRGLLPTKHQSSAHLHPGATRREISLFCQLFIYRNSLHLSGPVEFSCISNLNMRSGEHAWVCKTSLHLDATSWVLGEWFSLLTFCFCFSRLIKCHHLLVTVAFLQNAPHTFCWWHTTPLSATGAFDGRLGSVSSLQPA